MLCKEVCKKCINKAAADCVKTYYLDWKPWSVHDKDNWARGYVSCRILNFTMHSIKDAPPTPCKYKFEHSVGAAYAVQADM